MSRSFYTSMKTAEYERDSLTTRMYVWGTDEGDDMYDEHEYDDYEWNEDEEEDCMCGCSVACGVGVFVGGGKWTEVVVGHGAVWRRRKLGSL